MGRDAVEQALAYLKQARAKSISMGVSEPYALKQMRPVKPDAPYITAKTALQKYGNVEASINYLNRNSDETKDIKN